VARTPSGPNLWLSLFRTAEAVERVARKSMNDAGLGFSDFVILESLLHLGPLTPSTLAEKSNLTSGSITAALDRLAAKNLVERGSNPEDQRSRIVRLTDAGRGVIGPAYSVHASDIERLMGRALTAEQRGQLFELLQLLRKTANDELT
jgi:MarR family 2-MHQ and catechol resistance regulon transcriptional repressor